LRDDKNELQSVSQSDSLWVWIALG